MSAHTLGPWKIGSEADTAKSVVSERNPDLIAVWGPCPPFALGCVKALVPDAADARLIAAAPRMLEALDDTLRYAVMYFPEDDPDAMQSYHEARAAIAQAKGETK